MVDFYKDSTERTDVDDGSGSCIACHSSRGWHRCGLQRSLHSCSPGVWLCSTKERQPTNEQPSVRTAELVASDGQLGRSDSVVTIAGSVLFRLRIFDLIV